MYKNFVVRILALFTVLLGGSGVLWAAVPGREAQGKFNRVLIVVLENADYDEALKQPGLAKLAEDGALLEGFHAEAHHSQPNYIGLVSGALNGVRSNDPVTLDVKHLGDLLEAKGRTWKAYLEDYPGGCFKGERSGNYVRKHNPFISFLDIQRSPERCARLEPGSQLRADAANGKLPEVALYIPNLKNDGHDTGAAHASRWLTETLVPSLGSPFPKDLLLIVTFDESGSSQGDNRIYTALYGAGVKTGARSRTRYDHYSILRTLEDRFELGTLGLSDAQAGAINGVWN